MGTDRGDRKRNGGAVLRRAEEGGGWSGGDATQLWGRWFGKISHGVAWLVLRPSGGKCGVLHFTARGVTLSSRAVPWKFLKLYLKLWAWGLRTQGVGGCGLWVCARWGMSIFFM